MVIPSPSQLLIAINRKLIREFVLKFSMCIHLYLLLNYPGQPVKALIIVGVRHTVDSGADSRLAEDGGLYGENRMLCVSKVNKVSQISTF